jgi:hypothetical protein
MHYYFVQTAHSIASEPYSNQIELLLGIMQGAGHSVCLWALTSSIMLDQMKTTHGAKFHSPYPTRMGCGWIGESLVDDTSL